MGALLEDLLPDPKCKTNTETFLYDTSNDSGQCVTANNVKEEGILINNRDLFYKDFITGFLVIRA